MSAVFKKLNLKDQTEILVLDPPESFEPEIDSLDGVGVARDVDSVDEISFVLAFVMSQERLNQVAAAVIPKVVGDAVVWFAYPKKSSKRYTCDFDRDTGWQVLGDAGFEGVRMVAIDEDFSALRLRRAEYIRTMKRAPKHAMSAAGKKKTGAR